MLTSDWFAPHTRPWVVGHRGASAAAPQNTLAAFRTALDMGADGVELDVHLSSDGQVAVIHDFSVDKTTDGTGRVADKTLAQLKALDAGSRFSAQFAGERIPTLSEVFDALQGKLLVNVELKSVDLSGEAGLEKAVVEIVRRHGMDKRVLFSSFNPLSVRRVKQIAPEIPAGLLYAPDQPAYLSRAWLAPLVPHEARHPHFKMVTDTTMRWYKAHGLRVNTWTVDGPEDIRRLAALGVDSIISNKPDVLRQVLAQ